MKEKIDNLDMVSIGEYYPCEIPFKAHFGTGIGLDHLEVNLFHYGKPLRVVGFWLPTRDYNFVRVVVDVSELPYEVTPFMRMQIFLSKMDETANMQWRIEREKEWKRREEEEIKREEQSVWDIDNPEEVAKRKRIAKLRGERNILFNRLESCLHDKPFGVDTREEDLRNIEGRLENIQKELLTLGVATIG